MSIFNIVDLDYLLLSYLHLHTQYRLSLATKYAQKLVHNYDKISGLEIVEDVNI